MSKTPRFIRLLLRFYPQRFREMLERDLLDTYRDAQMSVLAVAWDLTKNAFAIRFDRFRRTRDETPRAPIPFLETLWRDVRFGVRSLVKKPTFAFLTLVTLMLGVGANTAIFTVVNWVVLRPLPYAEPDALVRVWWRPGSFNQRIVERLEEVSTFAEVSAFAGWAFSLTGEGEPQEIHGAQVTTNHFAVLGIEPHIGRAFVPEESQPGRSDVVVISHGLWQRRYGGDDEVLGRRVELSGAGRNAYTIVGVLPASHAAVDPAGRWEVWVPLERAADMATDDSWFLSVVARLEPKISLTRASAEVKALARRVKEDWYPRTSEEEIAQARVERLIDVAVGRGVRARLWLLLGAVGIVLLVVCSNVANLLFARGTDRARELAIRTALGAGRRRLFRQLMTEHGVLGLLGGALGVAVAFSAVSLLARHLPSELPRTDGLAVDARVVVFSAVVALGATLLFGLVPALRATGPDLPATLRSGGARISGRQQLQRLLVAGEVGASVVLVLLAGLVIKSFWKLNQIDPGFEPERVFVLSVYAPDARYSEPEERRQFFRELMPRLASIPGVEAAGSIHILPMSVGSWDFPYYPEGRVIGEGEAPPAASFRVVAPGYFRSMAIPLIAGRPLAESDRDGVANVGLVNESFAKEAWPEGDPIGKEINVFSAGGPGFTVVGVVADVRQHALDIDARPEMYRPLDQWTLGRNFVTLRTALAPESLAKPAREVVRELDPNVPVVAMGSMASLVARSVATNRFVTTLLAVFAGLTLFLAAVGVYGVTSYIVSQRTHEIGLSMALGAGRSLVLRQAMRHGMQPVVIGMGLGVGCALLASSWVERLLFGVGSADPSTFAAVVLFLGSVALAACYIPARRASRIDLMTALRVD